MPVEERDRRQLRLLLVEDSERDARALLAHLQEEGYEVYSRRVEDEQGLGSALLEGGWDIVLSEVTLERFNVASALRLVRAVGPELPFLIVSREDEDERATRYLRMGAQDFLCKRRLFRLAPAIERERREAAIRTEQRKGERERRALYSALEKAVQFKDESLARMKDAVSLRDEFLTVASHELRTPLTPLMLHLTSLSRALEASGDQGLLRRARLALRSTRRLERIIEDMLEVGRIRSHRMRLRFERFDLVSLIDEEVGRFARQAARLGTELRVSAPHVVVEWDRKRVGHILRSLLSNAIKFGAGCPVDIRAEVEGDWLRLTVSDQGAGVAMEDRERIFRLYERAVPVDGYGGLGLGLYIARHIAQLHFGTVYVSEGKNGGAVFTVELPVQARLPADTERPGESGAGNGGGSSSSEMGGAAAMHS